MSDLDGECNGYDCCTYFLRNKELEAENTELQKDRKRLDWCASTRAEFYRDEPYWIIRWLDPTADWMAEQESAMANNWREAIDEAMGEL